MRAHSTDNSLYTFIETELTAVKASLAQNTNPANSPEAIAQLQAQLDLLWDSIKTNGFVESIGIDAELRPAYVIMQGIIEAAQVTALKESAITAEAFIVTPRMCTPLMLAEGQDLAEIDLSKPTAFALFRKPILDAFLGAGGVVHAVYSHNAKTALADKDAFGLANYALNVDKYNNLLDLAVIKIDMDKFPSYLTGAMYYAGGMPITVESKQVTQIDNETAQMWAIKFGESAKSRVLELNTFFKENEADYLVREVEWGQGI